MNKFFEFTTVQLRFISVLTATAVGLGGFLLIQSWVRPTEQTPALEFFAGENEKLFTGLFVLDPNTSPADSLELLPGIGPVLADRIVSFRAKSRFMEVIDITNVRGIGPRLYERIKPYLKVRR